MNFCKENGIKVPEDISIVGIDNAKLASICEVPLTTVSHPHQLLGERAAELLMQMLSQPNTENENILFEPELVSRQSVQKL